MGKRDDGYAIEAAEQAIRLAESPLGLVDLREDRFRDGRAAAAAIVAGMNAARLRAERAKVGRSAEYCMFRLAAMR